LAQGRGCFRQSPWSLRRAECRKKWAWALFVLLVVGQAWLQIHRQREDAHKAYEQSAAIKQQNADIQNLTNDLHKSDIQRQVDNAILRTKLEDYAQFAQLGPALMKLAQLTADYQKKQFETKQTTDRELYALTTKAIKAIRDFYHKYSALEANSSLELTKINRDSSLSEVEKNQKWREETNKLMQLHFRQQDEFRTEVLPEVTLAYNELLRRRLPEPTRDPSQKSEVNMVLRGTLAGPHPELVLANYLEEWVKPLARN